MYFYVNVFICVGDYKTNGIIRAIKRPDVVVIMPGTNTAYAVKINTTLDMAGLQHLSLYGGGTYLTHYFSLYNYNNKRIHSSFSAYDCTCCLAHNRRIDPNWTITSKHHRNWPKKIFTGERYPHDIAYTDAETIKMKKEGKLLIVITSS